jgi:hypothetical protein
MDHQLIHDDIAHAVRMPHRELRYWRFGAQVGYPELELKLDHLAGGKELSTA